MAYLMTDMEKIYILNIFCLLLKLSIVLGSFPETSCFWRINLNENLDADMRTDCGFILFKVAACLEEDYFRVLLDFPLPVKTYQYVLVILFAIEEINKDPTLLPIITLGFTFLGDQCDITTSDINDLNMFSKSGHMVPNYICEDSHCDVAITGPTWSASARVGALLQIFTFPQVNDFLKNIKFINPVGDPVNINEKEKINAIYDILNVLKLPQGQVLKVKIGQFFPYVENDQQLFLSEDMIEWRKGSRKFSTSVCSASCHPGFKKSHCKGNADCCFECSRCPANEISNTTDVEQCVKCPDDSYANTEQTCCLPKVVTFLAYEDPLGMTLVCMTLCFSALTVFILGVFVKYKDTPIVKANNRTLSYILLISLTFCFLCSLLFIGNPSATTCILQQITFGILFTVAVSTVLAKTITVVLAFSITIPGRRMQGLGSKIPKCIIPTCTLVQIILCEIWLVTSPPHVDIDVHSEHGHIIITCSKGSVTTFYCVLGYLVFLAFGSFAVAFLARNLPDTFNEAKFLTFSMLVFCSVWITFLPVYHSTKGKVMVAVEVFSILASSVGLLGCIFVSKCYIILLKPDKNSIKTFRDKTHTQAN